MYITYTLCGGWFGKEGLRVEMEGRKDGQLGGKTRTTLTHPDKSVTIATLKRPTGSWRVDPTKGRCMYYVENVERSKTTVFCFSAVDLTAFSGK